MGQEHAPSFLQAANNLIPLAGAPISQISQILQTCPLNSEWYFAPSKGQATLGEPPYIGV